MSGITPFARLLIVTLALVWVAPAATVRNLTFDEVLERSDSVVYGRVLTNRSFFDTATRTIWTKTEIQVLDPAKGKVGSSVFVTEPGGVLGNLGHLFPGVPRFEPGQEVVVFLYASEGTGFRVTGMGQGVYVVTTDALTSVKMARQSIETRELVYVDGSKSIPAMSAQNSATGHLDVLLQRVRGASAK